MVVAFIGQRKTDITEELKERLTKTIRSLIEDEGADIFLFGFHSEFRRLCHEIISELRKRRFPDLRRIFVRTMFPCCEQYCREYLSLFYEDTLYPKIVECNGSVSPLARNRVMIDGCDVLVTYCDKNYRPPYRTSNAKRAVEYAQENSKRIINLFEGE